MYSPTHVRQGTGDEFPLRLCDPLPPVTAGLYHHWLAAGFHDEIISQGVGDHGVYMGIRHPDKEQHGAVYDITI